MTMLRSISLSGSKYFNITQSWNTRQKLTIAALFKTSSTSTPICSYGYSGTTYRVNLRVSSGQIYFDVWFYDGSSEELRFSLLSTETISNGSWNHVLVGIDTSQVTAANRAKLYLNGSEVTYSGGSTWPLQNSNVINSGYGTWYWGRSGSSYFNGLLDECYLIDSVQGVPSSFINTAPLTPKVYTGSYGAHGCYLNFENYSSAVALGYDASGHGINWTPNNITTSDSSTDVASGFLFVATGLSTGSPELANPELLSGVGAMPFVVGSPDIDQAILTELGINLLSPVGLATLQPSISQPILFNYKIAALGPDWVVSDAAVIGGPFLGPDEQATAVALIDSAAAGPFEISQSIVKDASPKVFRFSIDAAPTESGKYLEVGLTDDAGGKAAAVFDVETGECLYRISESQDFRFLDVEADPTMFDYYRLVIMAATASETTLRAYARLCDADLSPTYTGDGFGSVLLQNPLLLEGYDTRQFRWEIGEPEMRFYWTVHFSDLGLRWFRCGQSELGVDPHLRFITAMETECVLQRWQPAQDSLVLDYGGELLTGGGDPMAGTP